MSVSEGACLCGAVRFRATAPPKWVAHCHCSICRRAHGAAYVTWAGFLVESVAVSAGADALTKFASTPEATREHCMNCGSPLFFRGKRWPNEVHVARAAFPGDIGKEATAHVFFSDKASWVHVDDGLPRKGGSSGTEPL